MTVKAYRFLGGPLDGFDLAFGGDRPPLEYQHPTPRRVTAARAHTPRAVYTLKRRPDGELIYRHERTA